MSLAEALKGIKETQTPAKAETKKPKTARVRTPVVPAEIIASAETGAGRVRGKSAHPDYEKVTLYARRDLRRQAERKFEDAGGRDLSDLLETLLRSYLNG